MKPLFFILSFLLLLCARPETGRVPTAPDTDSPGDAVATPAPEPEPVVIAGQTLTKEETELDLSGLAPEEIVGCMDALARLPELRRVKLDPAEGPSPWTLDQAGALVIRYPDLLVDYTATVFGVTFNLTDEVVSFNHIDLSGRVDELRSVLPYLAHVGRLDMEYCEIPDEQMAALRADFPAPKIVWRVFVKGIYHCRTDAIMIRFSFNADMNRLYDKDTHPLIYCNEVRYLDLGHDHISDAYFTAYMPDLEVCILAVGDITHISALANCPKLEYLEIFTGHITDISVLAGLKNLKHLNIANNQITDISPLFELDLERLWMSRNPIPKEQIEAFRQRFPNCEINTTCSNPTGDGWRGRYGYAPRYKLLREQFCYYYPSLLSYSAFDIPVKPLNEP